MRQNCGQHIFKPSSPLGKTKIARLLTACLALVIVMVIGCSGGPPKQAPSATAQEDSRSTSAPAKKPDNPPVSRPAPSRPTASVSKTPSTPAPPPRVKSEPVETTTSRTTRQTTRKVYKKKAKQTEKKDNSLDALLGTSPTMTAQESSSGSSIRGLSPVSEHYGQDHNIPDEIMDAVRSMEQFEINEQELKRFKKKGQLVPPQQNAPSSSPK